MEPGLGMSVTMFLLLGINAAQRSGQNEPEDKTIYEKCFPPLLPRVLTTALSA